MLDTSIQTIEICQPSTHLLIWQIINEQILYVRHFLQSWGCKDESVREIVTANYNAKLEYKV